MYIKAYDKLLGEKRWITVEYTVLTNRRPCQSLNNAKGYGIMELIFFFLASLGIFFSFLNLPIFLFRIKL